MGKAPGQGHGPSSAMDSFITHASIQAIAHSLDIPKLSDEAAKALAPDVDYRLREIIQVSWLQVSSS